jgi:DNA-binding transcriptional MocR family regulator
MPPQIMGTETPLPSPLAPASKRLDVKRHVVELIASGALRRGSRVPSILELARLLGVAKNTVIGALNELCDVGVLEARERQGFFVRTVRRRERAKETRLIDLEINRVAHGMASILVQSGEDFVPIGSGTAAESMLATPEWSATLKGAPPRDPRLWLRYADPMGEPRLREAIAARYGAIDEPASRVIITFGAVEALNLTFAATAAERKSRRIGIESPGYFMLQPILEHLGLEAVSLPRSQGGLDFDRLAHETRKGPLAAVMVNPNHQNPVGTTLTLAERFELAKRSDQEKFWIIEDDVYRGLWTESEEPSTIHSLVPHRTLFVSSFSKTLGPALRIGFILAPDALLADLRRRKFLSTLSGDAYTQNIVADFVERRGYERHLAEMRDELSRRARIAHIQADAFRRLGRFAGRFSGGLFWRFEFNDSIDAMALYRFAREKNVLVSPGCFFQHDPSSRSAEAWMRVNVSRCEGSTLTKVLTLLASAARD